MEERLSGILMEEERKGGKMASRTAQPPLHASRCGGSAVAVSDPPGGTGA